MIYIRQLELRFGVVSDTKLSEELPAAAGKSCILLAHRTFNSMRINLHHGGRIDKKLPVDTGTIIIIISEP